MSATPNHGPLFDEFRGGARDSHGPQHDEFGSASGPSTAHGALHDEFTRRVTHTGHGEHWDDFDWKPMPAMHGQNMDNDFSQPAALDGGEHGTWHDVFRGGTNVRCIVAGQDVEGVVLETHADHMTVLPRGGANQGGRGKPVEVGLGQIRELRAATEQGQAKESRKPTASPGKTQEHVPRSTAHAPSAHDAKAHGGGRTPIEVPSDAKAMAVKSELDDVDVAKTLDEIRALAGE